MAGPYTGAFALESDSDDDKPHSQPSSRLPAIDPAAAAAAASPPPQPPPRSPSPSTGPPRLLYIRSQRLAQLAASLPINADRPALTHSLVEAYGLLEGVTVEEAAPASAQQLLQFHSREYLQALTAWDRLSERQRAAAGLEDDCAPFPGLYELAALTAGGSLAAAAGLCSGRHRLAVHFDGGRHHAHKSKAAGFCYANDIVLAILALLGSFRRVLYVDIDVHHCDAVEEAFELTPRVLTVSLHKHAPGFFPGTGAPGAGGAGPGAGYSLNLALRDGLRDGLFSEAFGQLAGGAAAAFRPDAVVLQCGVDGLAQDPLAASWALTPAAYAAAAAQAASWGAPLLLLGGGGYDSPAAAATWAGVLAALLQRRLPDDIPEHDFLDRYAPYSFTLSGVARRMLPPDSNDREKVLAACQHMVAGLRNAVERGSSGSGSGGGREPEAKRARPTAAG